MLKSIAGGLLPVRVGVSQLWGGSQLALTGTAKWPYHPARLLLLPTPASQPAL
jgi:hypothetical protein